MSYAQVKVPARLEIGTECVGKFNFLGSAAHDLPFKRGDTLVITGHSKDPNWYKARRFDDLEGMVPYNFIQSKKNTSAPSIDTSSATSTAASQDAQQQQLLRATVPLQSMPWFHGKLTRDEVENIMMDKHKNGLFLVRESQNFPGDYTLCISYDGRVEHFRVLKDKRNWVSVDDEEYFENLFKLVEHYQKDADGLICRLKYSVDKIKDVEFIVSESDFKDRGWAIPRKDCMRKALIGKGEFKEVWIGEYIGIKVAIKMQKDPHAVKANQQLLREASIMTSLRHPNVESLIGVSLDITPIYLITEYMAKGALLDYVRSRGRAVITRSSLYEFAKHICKAMVYLESKNLVHRDLAARNILISEDNVAKLSGFHLAMFAPGVPRKARLPVKWTALEALRENKFSNKSDVWSFGIVLWELFSYGRVPYPYVSIEEVIPHIDRGRRMDCPDGCPDKVYRIMQNCWRKDPSQRPNFTRIDKQLQNLGSLLITQHPETQTKVYGDKVKLSISAVGPDPRTYQWLKDGKAITAAAHSPSFTGTNSSTLEINPFLPAHVGSYKCVVSHVPSDKKIETNTASLHLGGEILSKAKLSALKTLLSEEVIGKLKEREFSINKDDTSVTLQQVQYLLNTVGEASMAATLKEKLILSNKQHPEMDEDSKNTEKKDAVDGTKVSLQITQHPETQSKIYGDQVKLTVSAKGPDLVTYQWWKDGKIITTEDYPNCTGIDSSTLEISPFIPEYEGSYKCIVSHKAADKEVESRSAQLTLGGQILTKAELLALRSLFSEHVISKLTKGGFSIPDMIEKDVATTLQQVQYILKNVGESTTCDQLKEELYSSTTRNEFLQQALKEGFCVALKYLKFLFLGPPRAGKTTFLRRLINEIISIGPQEVEPSTPVAEIHDGVIMVSPDEEQMGKKSAVITKSNWSSVKSDGDLDKEALVIYRFIKENKEDEDMAATSDTATENQQNTSIQILPRSPVTSDESDGAQMNQEAQVLKPKQALQQLEANKDQKLENEILEEFLDPEVEMVFEKWESLLIQQKYSQIEKILTNSILANMIDMGGQPPFLDMLPALTIGPALYLICFNLQNEISQRYSVMYVSESGVEYKLQYSYSVLEVIFQSLSSIACLSPTSDQPQPIESMPPPCQIAIIVGTHRDKVSETTASSKDEEIQKELKKLLEYEYLEEEPYHNYLSKTDGRLVLCVDNTGGVDEIDRHRKVIEEMINEKFYDDSKYRIPASWLMFSIFLRKMHKDVITIEQCQQIAKRLHIPPNHTKDVLWYLHHHIGILMYYRKDEVEGLEKDVIICQPQVIFTSVSQLILNAFLPERSPNDLVQKKFWERGQFRLKDVRKALEFESQEAGLTVDQLLSILQFLSVLVKLTDDVFFLPAVLRVASDEELLSLLGYSHSQVAPLMIRFCCVFVPLGCFSALIARLVSTMRKSWKLSENVAMFKNMVTFQVEGSYYVTLVARLKRYEVHLAPIPETTPHRPTAQVAKDVLATVCKTLDSVLDRLRKQYTSSPDLTMYQFGFICCHNVCTQDLRDSQQEHLMLFERGEHTVSGSLLIKCIQNDTAVTLQPCHLIWSGESSSNQPMSTQPSETPEYRTMVKCTRVLRTAVQTHLFSLGASLLSEELISTDNDSDIRNTMHSEPERAARLIEILQLQVKLEPQNFHTFLSVLDNDRDIYKDILKTLKEKYQSFCT